MSEPTKLPDGRMMKIVSEDEMRAKARELIEYFKQKNIPPEEAVIVMDMAVLAIQANIGVVEVQIMDEETCHNPDCPVHGKNVN